MWWFRFACNATVTAKSALSGVCMQTVSFYRRTSHTCRSGRTRARDTCKTERRRTRVYYYRRYYIGASARAARNATETRLERIRADTPVFVAAAVAGH